ncbi:Aste57867_16618 [Aphanomyces stellatus]|uniref:Aste57867_16618 protein n=1 Tax=Aphanomyces stellatus TaxID=120398 RepID=A0A485L6Q6_9STRA|nr:hypothetical protein As57867_016561 [Aphanomyces stellatus]VFT93389.1 Aste57867_16618 [Aphanomyces stellatus]
MMKSSAPCSLRAHVAINLISVACTLLLRRVSHTHPRVLHTHTRLILLFIPHFHVLSSHVDCSMISISSPNRHSPPPSIYCLATDSRLFNVDLARLWHRRLGHPGLGALDQMIKDNPELRMFQKRHIKELLCETCAYAKSKRAPFKSAAVFRAQTPLVLVHTDIWGPCPIPSAGGSLYFILFVDDFSRFTWAYPVARRTDLYKTYKTFRTDAMSIFKSDISALHHAAPADIGTLQSDNVKEYEKLQRKITPKYNTRMTFSNAYSPAQNEVAERRIGIIVQKLRAMLIDDNLPKFLWSAALEYACWLVNISPSRANDGKTPYYKVFGTHPSLCYIKAFGCTAYVHIQKAAQPTKLDGRSLKAMFIGIPSNRKGYTLMHLHSHERIYSRDVEFIESEFPAINTIEAAALYRRRASSDPSFHPTIEPNAPLPPLLNIIRGSRPNMIVFSNQTSDPIVHSAVSSASAPNAQSSAAPSA